MSESKQILEVEEHLASCDGRAYSPEERSLIISTLIACMEAGESMSAACIRLQVTPGTFWRWCREDDAVNQLYINTKKMRSRAMIEAAIYEIQNNPDAKSADMRARHYIRLAALLSPTEFSDKLHAVGSKAGLGGGNTTFVLNFSGTPSHASRELVSVPLPEDSD